jgi:glyoxylate reductase
MYTDRVTPAMLDRAPRLRVLVNYAIGYDNIPVAECTRRGIMVANTPLGNESVADLTWALILSVSRRVLEANRVVLSGEWRAWSSLFVAGQDINGATIGIIGMGRIGLAVARRAVGFNMRILYHNRRPAPEAEQVGAIYTPLPDLLRESDVVCVLVPLTPDTHHLIGAAQLALMKPTAILINTSRGPVVDEKALYRTLADKRIWGAGLDVFEVEPVYPYHPLMQLENVVVAPHIGSSTMRDRIRMAQLAAENIQCALSGERPPTLLNPDVIPRSFGPSQAGVNV